MAEGLFTLLAGKRVEAFSAGVEPQGYVHPLAIRVMEELAVDMSHAHSKSVDQFLDADFDVVITVCDHAAKTCPTFPGGTTRLHWPTEDPFDALGDEQARLSKYRQIRDELRLRIKQFLAEQEPIA